MSSQGTKVRTTAHQNAAIQAVGWSATCQQDWRMRRKSCRWNQHLAQKSRTNYITTLETPPDNIRQRQSKGEPSRTERRSRYFSESPMCWKTHLVELKNPNWSDTNSDGHTRITMGGESALPTNPDKGHTENRKTNYSDCPRDASTGD